MKILKNTIIFFLALPILGFQGNTNRNKGSSISFEINNTRTYIFCHNPTSPNASGFVDVSAVTTVLNSDIYQLNYRTKAILQTKLNNIVILDGEDSSRDRHTIVYEYSRVPVSSGPQFASTKHTGNIEWIIEPPTGISDDKIVTTTSKICTIATYQPPQSNDSDCTGNCGQESFQISCKQSSSPLTQITFESLNIDWEQCQESPLLINLGKNGFRLGRRGEGAYFDILGIGETCFMQWVRPGGDEVFLVRDLDGNGQIDDGRELFGEGTRLVLQDNIPAPNGFVALGQFDDPALGGNADGYITSADGIWFELQLWHDQNADGQTNPGELLHLEDAGITRLDIVPRESRRMDAAGNSLRFWSWTYDDHATGRPKYKMVDVFFRRIH